MSGHFSTLNVETKRDRAVVTMERQ